MGQQQKVNDFGMMERQRRLDRERRDALFTARRRLEAAEKTGNRWRIRFARAEFDRACLAFGWATARHFEGSLEDAARQVEGGAR